MVYRTCSLSTTLRNLLLASAVVTPAQLFASSGNMCSREAFLATLNTVKENATPLFAKAVKPIGIVVGSANEVVKLTCGQGFLPSFITPWLPLSNEIANVLATSTGAKWIYSGLSKDFADNISLGYIFTKTTAMTITHGPVAGGITLAANMGFSFWFPNKYFHTIMHSLPERIPGEFVRLKSFAQSGKGQFFIGASLIVIIEQALLYSNMLAEKASTIRIFENEDKPKALDGEIQVRQALAAMLIDDSLSENISAIPSVAQETQHDLLLRYVVGNSGNGVLFSNQTAKPIVNLNQMKPTGDEREKLKNLKPKDVIKKVEKLLDPQQQKTLEIRLAWAQQNLT